MALRLLGTGTGAPAGMVETVGFDPTTPRSQTECASKLRYASRWTGVRSVVELEGVEPSASRLQGERSSQLSYSPKVLPSNMAPSIESNVAWLSVIWSAAQAACWSNSSTQR